MSRPSGPAIRGRIRITLLAVALGAAALPAALADDGRIRPVAIPGKAFAPGTIEILRGDTVTWTNDDSTDHTVTADTAPFDSGYLSPGTTFSLTFPRLGHYAYHCSIHKYMKGVVVVVPVALAGTGRAIVSGGSVVLHGLAPVGTTRIDIAPAGTRAGGVRHAVPASDGSFTVTVRAFVPQTYVARVNGLASPPVTIHVAPLVRATVHGRTLTVRARPGRPGAPVVLQRYVRERFAWHTVTRTRLDHASQASVGLPVGAGRYRIVVRGGHGWVDGASGSIVRR